MNDISKYIADSLSRRDIRAIANKVRHKFELYNKLDFPIIYVVEKLSADGEFDLEICPNNEMGTKFGETIPSKKLIKIREDIYDNAYGNDGFSRATIAHELGHWEVGHDEWTVSFCRREEDFKKRKAYQDPEWQASCYAGELLVPKHLVKGMTINEVIERCTVSWSMAEYQLRKYNQEGRNI